MLKLPNSSRKVAIKYSGVGTYLLGGGDIKNVNVNLKASDGGTPQQMGGTGAHPQKTFEH